MRQWSGIPSLAAPLRRDAARMVLLDRRLGPVTGYVLSIRYATRRSDHERTAERAKLLLNRAGATPTVLGPHHASRYVWDRSHRSCPSYGLSCSPLGGTFRNLGQGDRLCTGTVRAAGCSTAWRRPAWRTRGTAWSPGHSGYGAAGARPARRSCARLSSGGGPASRTTRQCLEHGAVVGVDSGHEHRQLQPAVTARCRLDPGLARSFSRPGLRQRGPPGTARRLKESTLTCDQSSWLAAPSSSRSSSCSPVMIAAHTPAPCLQEAAAPAAATGRQTGQTASSPLGWPRGLR